MIQDCFQEIPRQNKKDMKSNTIQLLYLSMGKIQTIDCTIFENGDISCFGLYNMYSIQDMVERHNIYLNVQNGDVLNMYIKGSDIMLTAVVEKVDSNAIDSIDKLKILINYIVLNLNGINLVEECIKTYKQYLDNKCDGTLSNLSELYDNIPGNERRFLNNRNEGVTESMIRSVINGDSAYVNKNNIFDDYNDIYNEVNQIVKKFLDNN